MRSRVRKPVLKLDNYTAYMSQEHIEIPVMGIGDPLVYDLLYMLKEADYRIYFEESFYKVLEWEIDTLKDVILLKMEKENNNVRKV